jgi:protein involved in polysaccharide export with SLBB domain
MRQVLLIACFGLTLSLHAASQPASPGVAPPASVGTVAAPSGPSVISNTQGPVPPLPTPTTSGGDAAEVPRSNASQPGVGARPVTPPSTEFQRFVAASTGQVLPLFGEGFFAGTHTFTPLERVPVPADYVLGPGDELHVRTWGNVEIDYRTSVDRNGQISIPRLGTVGVAGLKASELDGHLRNFISRVFKGFSLSVSLGQLRSIQVFVVGQAHRPGSYTVSSLSTLINAVFASGGPGANGSMRRVQLKRGNAVLTELDLYEFIVQGDKSKDVRLLPGDTIVYLSAGPRVAVLGAVDTSAVYELKPTGSPLSEVLSLAGGARAHSDAHFAQLERIDPAQPKAPRSVQSLELKKSQSLVMRDGDVLMVFPVPPQFSNAVTLRGNVAEPLRYPYTPGMRISQLIPEREALITRDYYLRKNKLVQFLEKRSSSLAEMEASTRAMLDEPNWEYATIERLDVDKLTTQLLPFNLGKAVLERDPAHDLVLQPGDVVTILGSREVRRPQARGTRLIRVEGEVDRPGIYQALPGETLRMLLARAGGITPQAYLYGLEFSRESTRKKQREALNDALKRLEASLGGAAAQRSANLTGVDPGAASRLQAAEEEARRAQLNRLRTIQPNGRIALELTPSISRVEDLPDIPLEDGDSVQVPSRPGFVFSVGAVANENALLWRPGRTAKNYLAIAGVLPEADEANIFIVRADGSVLHPRNRTAGLFARNPLDSFELAPGDTLVVPDRIDRESPWNAFVRGAKDWTQILANFGLAAAGLKTLRN